MGLRINREQSTEFIRTESLWLSKNDSSEVLKDGKSNKINQLDPEKVNGVSPFDLESQSQPKLNGDLNSKFLHLYRSSRLSDLKPFDALSKFLSTPFGLVTTTDEVPNQEPLDVECLSDDYLSDSSSSISELNENELILDESDQENPKPVMLKDLMIYKTIQFMDYRRFSRRFNGIRKPVSNKKALLICMFCAVLALVPFVVFRVQETHYVVSLQVKRGALPYVSSLAFLLAAFLLAKIQLSLPLRLPVILSYLFMFITLIILIVARNLTEIDRFVWPLLISYASVQVFLIALTKAFIYFVPILALNGHFFACAEHFHLLKRSEHDTKLNITISRYNDLTSIWATRSCGFFTCIYRTFYRIFLNLRRKCNGRRHRRSSSDEPLFGHQMRYYGRIDSNNLPHGYGEWLEDHIYGERLHGYWWHGYPVGPFTSQEIGSGSIFVNNRVAFMTDTHLGRSKTRYGVSSTECSISGHFFKQMPETYFFNPEYRKLKESRKKEKCDIFYLHHKSFKDIRGSSPQWCIGMLKRQFHLNRPNNQVHMSIYVDKLTDSLKIEGHRLRQSVLENKTDEITIRLVKYKGDTRKMLTPRANNQPNSVQLPGFRPFTKNGLSKRGRELIEKPQSEVHKTYQSQISMLIRDEDDWDHKQHMEKHKIVANGWARVRPSIKNNVIPEHVVLYIHGYNTTLNEACSQMAHIVSFAKLPPYILPFVFNWKGHHWGLFSAFSYPKAIRRCQNPNIEESFLELVQDLIDMGIKNIHFLVHSCGARVFFNVIIAAINAGLIMPVLNEEFLIVNPDSTKKRLRMDSVILINPDYPMERFRNNEYFVIRGYCDHIVMYVNNRDHCLWVSEFYNRERSLGKCIFEMCTSPSILSKVIKKEVQEDPFTIYEGHSSSERMGLSNSCCSVEPEPINDCGNLEELNKVPENKQESQSMGGSESDSDSEDEGSNERSESPNSLNKVTIKEVNGVGRVDSKERTSKMRRIFKPRYSFNRYRRTKNIFWSSRSSSDLETFDNRHLWLDMDVIDTSMIDTNVDFLKHSFYQVKREIMDDIREVILMHTRAEHRQTRLDRRRGNVYVFRVAPGDVRKLF